MDVTKKRTDFSPQTIKKAFSLLDHFSLDSPEMSAKELGYATKLNASTLYRYLGILEEADFLYKDLETGKYSPGLRLVELGGIALSRLEFHRHGQPALDRISLELKMNANMGILYEGDILHIAFSVWINAPHYGIVGRRTAATNTAMGKLLLSALETKDVHEIITRYGWRPRTKNAIKSFSELDKEIRKIRKAGYAIDDEEGALGSCCLAFPVIDQQGNAVAAISATTETKRFKTEFDTILATVRKNALEVSYRMGYHGDYPVIFD